MALFNFNANEVEPADNNFTPLPVGEYKVIITNTEQKNVENKPGNSYISFTFEVIDGKYKGRKLFENLNLWRNTPDKDKDQKTMNIAQQNLSAICRAVGKMKIKDTQELCNKPILATVKITPPSGNYGEGNRITKYTAINGGNTLPQKQETKKEKYPTPEPEDIEENSMPWAQ